MKHLKLFFALFAMLALGVGNAWADDVTFSWSGSATADAGKTDYVVEQTPVTLTFAAGTAQNAPRTNKEGSVRMYANTTLTISCASGNITKVTFTPTSASYSATKLKYNGTALTSDEWTLSSPSNEVTLTASANARFKTIVVTYTSAGSGDEPSTPPTTYTIKWHTAVGTTTDVTLNEGETITQPATEPTMTGYEFMGWTDQCNVATDGVGFTPLTNFGTADSDKDFYAVFAVAETTGGGGTTTETLKGSDLTYSGNNGYVAFTATTASGTWSGKANYNTGGYIQINKNANNYHIGSPTFAGNVESVKITTTNNSATNRTFYIRSSNTTAQPTSGDLGSYKTTAANQTFTIDLIADAKQFYIYSSGAVYISQIDVTYGGGSTSYNNYITTCSGSTPVETLTDAQFAWSAATAEATMGASNTFPTLTNTLSVPVTYESSTPATATIAADGSITLVAPGTTTISAKFAGGEVGGTTYAAKTVTYALTVLKAPATPTENVYVKVTETAGITDGEYLIVYEDAEGNPKAPVAFDGSLATLDAAGNMMSVTITDNVINGNTEIDEVTFNISAMTGGYAIKSKSGEYIGRTTSGNGMNTGASEILNIITITDGKTTISGSGDGASTSLQYYSVSGSERFRYYGSNQKPIALYKKVDPSEILAPAFSVAAGSYYDAQSVEITCATPGAEIYYTLDGLTPSSTSTKYTSAVAISETKTLKAIAIKGEYSSSVTEATYTILAPLATMQEIFDKAKAVGTTATPVKVTMNNWVVTGVKGSNAYLTDGTKGLIIYTASHGFVVGDVLSGTVACKVQLYDGSAELTSLTKTTEGLTVTTGGAVTPVVVNDVTTLSGVNTGSVIKITGVCEKKTINDKEYYYVADVQLYNSLFAYTNPTVGKKYNVTGVYLQFGEVEEILPRKQEDIEEVQDLATATISVSNISLEVDETKTIAATITPDAAKTKVQYAITAGSEYITLNGATITGIKEGTATIRATIEAAAGKYYGTTKDFTVTVTPKSTKDKVVILAQYDSKWYALKADKVDNKTIAALEVTYFDGKLYNVDDEDKALIEWERAVVDGNATFKNGENYLSAVNSADLKLSTNACDWVYEGSIYKIESSDRTFLYRATANGFKNYDKDNADTDDYSSLPVVTAPVYTTGTLYTIKATAENGTVVGAGVYVAGDKVTLTADPAMDYTFVSWTKGGEVVSTANPFVFEATENLDLVANFTAISQTSKTLSGKFSTGKYEYAEFATGNLQYNTENDTWRFAKQQYQYVGEANINVGDPNYKGWIDMFGWSTDDADNNYGVNPNNVNDLYDGTFQDWGTKMGEGWSTLSADQWKYLLNTRTNASSLKQIARVGSVVGIMLFPDNWDKVNLVEKQYNEYFEVYIYNYTLEQWAELEEAGALFLPAAGRRTGGYGNMINKEQVEEDNPANLNGGHYKHQDNTNIYCYYWTSTINESTKDVSYLHNIQALGGDKYTIGTGAVWGEKGRYGQSVRLAKVTSTLVEIGDSGNTSVIAANNGKEVDVQVNRTFTADKLHTLCLPFDAPVNILGEGTKAYQLSGVRSLADGSLVVDVTLCSEMKAGAPYLVIPTNNFALGELIVDNVTMKNVDVTTVNNVVNNGEINVVFQGILDANGQTNGTTHYYIGTNSYLYNGTVDILGLRSMFIITGMPAGMRARVAFGENAATGLDNITNGENTTIKVIENGQLVIIRNGEKFNAQGVRF